jgi:predicted phage terminase large subunit-like protein
VFQAIVTTEGGEQRALWEAHTSLENLLRMRDDPTYEKYVGKLTFEREYMNRPFSETDAIIKPDWIQWCDMPDQKILKLTMFAVDPAISKRDTADYTGKIVGSKDDDDNIYVYYVSRDRMSFLENVDDIKRVDEIYKPRKVGVEKVAFQGAFQEVLKGLPVVELKPDADKVRRLLSVSRHFQAGKVYFVNGTPNIQELYHELLEFPDGAHDDLVDALVYLINMLIFPVSRPTIRRI